MQHKPGEEQSAGKCGAEQHRRRPAEVVPKRQRSDQQDDGRHEQAQAEPVERHSLRQVPAAGDEQQARHHAHYAERHVDEEEQAPATRCQQQSPNGGTQRQADGLGRALDADGAAE